MSLNLSKFGSQRGNLNFCETKKGDIGTLILPPKLKKKPIKKRFWTKQKNHIKGYGILRK